MANQHNLIRPPIIKKKEDLSVQSEIAREQQNLRQAHRQNEYLNNRIMNEHISEQIANQVGAALREQLPILLQELNTKPFDFSNAKNQTINENERGDLTALNRIPDIVKGIRDFPGDPI